MRDHLDQQSGVISRAQLLEMRLKPHDIARLLRRRELAPLHPGVYVNHTGVPTWWQRAWGAVLYCRTSTGNLQRDHGSAALSGLSAVLAAEGPAARDVAAGTAPIQVVVADERRPRSSGDLRVLRSSPSLGRVQWQLSPPMLRYEPAVLELAARSDRVVDTVGELARALGSRRTTPARLLAHLDLLPTLSGRGELRSILSDLAEGTCSVLEHAYLTRVERAHGLPRAVRQERSRARTGIVYRDAVYDGVIIELDGRAWHDSAAGRDRDADRDLVAAVAGRRTVRLTWGQVCDRPCWTAAMVAALLDVTPRPCSPHCLAPRGVSDFPTHLVS